MRRPEAAAQALIERHAGLRAAFRHEGLSRPVQMIVPGAQAPWRNIDLSLLDAADREQRLAGIRRKTAPSASTWAAAAPPVCADPAVGR